MNQATGPFSHGHATPKPQQGEREGLRFHQATSVRTPSVIDTHRSAWRAIFSL